MYQKLIKCFSNYIPIHIIPNILNEEDIDIVFEELVNNKDFEKSDTEIKTFDKKEDLKIPQAYENNNIIMLDDLNQKEMDDPRVQRCLRDQDISIYLFLKISQEYYELGKKQYAATVISIIYSNQIIF